MTDAETSTSCTLPAICSGVQCSTLTQVTMISFNSGVNLEPVPILLRFFKAKY